MKKQEKYTSSIDVWGIVCVFLDLLIDRDFDYAYQLLENKNVIYNIIKKRYQKESKVLCEFIDIIFRLNSNDRPTSVQLLHHLNELIKKLNLKVKRCDLLEIEGKNMKRDEDIGKKIESHHILKNVISEKEEDIYFLKENLKEMSRKYFHLKKINEESEKKNKSKKEFFNQREFELDKQKKPVFGKEFEVLFAKWKKKNLKVCLKRPREGSKKSKTIENTGKKKDQTEIFKKMTDFDNIKELDHENIEKVYGITSIKKKNYLVAGNFELPLPEYLRNFNYKLDIFAKAKICFDIIKGLYYLFKMNYVCKNLRVSKIILTTRITESGSKKVSVILGPFIISDKEKKRQKNIKRFYGIMKDIFFRCNEESSVEGYQLKNEFEAEYFEIIKSGFNEKKRIKSIVFSLAKLVDKQWLYIQELAKKKKNETSSSGRMILKNLKTESGHKINLSTSKDEK